MSIFLIAVLGFLIVAMLRTLSDLGHNTPTPVFVGFVLVTGGYLFAYTCLVVSVLREK